MSKLHLTRSSANLFRSIAVVASLVLSPLASAGVITEDFSGGTFDSTNFELGNAFGSGFGSAASGAYQGINRGTLRTVNSSLFGTISDPLTVVADLTFSNWDIAFLAVRSTGLPADNNKEPSDGLFLRIHNDHNFGQINVAEGANYGFYQTHPDSGSAFFDSTVRVTLIDYGNSLDISMLNLSSNELKNFSLNTSFSSGQGHVAFSSTSAAWDNISISHSSLGNAAQVPEPSVLGLMGLGAAGLMGFSRRKRKKAA